MFLGSRSLNVLLRSPYRAPLPLRHSGAVSEQPEDLVALARAQIQACSGHPFLAGLACLQLAHVHLSLGQPAEALPAVQEGEWYAGQLDEAYEQQRWVRMTSASAPPPGPEQGDPQTLLVNLGLARTRALMDLHRWADARVSADQVRPMVKGWGRRTLRRALAELDDQIARHDGNAREALDALDRLVTDPALSHDERLFARYERTLHLVDSEQYDDAIREALTLVRDAQEDAALAARARQALGAALAGAGREDDATLTLCDAFDGFVALEDHAAVVAAAPGLAWRLTSAGMATRAATVARAAQPSARALGDLTAQTDLLTTLGTSLDESGDAPGAVAAFHEAIGLAERIPDPVRAADARHGEAIARSRQADRSTPDDAIDALALLDAARVAYDAAGIPERAAGCMHESAAILGRLQSYDAARSRYEQALSAYLAIPEVLRVNDPPAIADCEFNLRALSDPAALSAARSAGCFASGGHAMQHEAPA